MKAPPTRGKLSLDRMIVVWVSRPLTRFTTGFQGQTGLEHLFRPAMPQNPKLHLSQAHRTRLYDVKPVRHRQLPQ